MTMTAKIEEVAELLYIQVYEAEFGGKTRGRFIVDRGHLKDLLGVKRLHNSTLLRLTDACLEEGLVLIDMDDRIGFAESRYVEKWRKVPDRLVTQYVSELNDDDDDDDDDADADNEKDDDED